MLQRFKRAVTHALIGAAIALAVSGVAIAAISVSPYDAEEAHYLPDHNQGE